MNSQTLNPKYANPPIVGRSPRDRRHPTRPPASESTLKQIGPDTMCFPGRPGSDLGSNTSNWAVLGPKRTTVRAPNALPPAERDRQADGSTTASTESALRPCRPPNRLDQVGRRG